jgi:uncharacterized protein with LGFP repeats
MRSTVSASDPTSSVQLERTRTSKSPRAIAAAESATRRRRSVITVAMRTPAAAPARAAQSAEERISRRTIATSAATPVRRS